MRVRCLVGGRGVFDWMVAVIVECVVGEDEVALAMTYDEGHEVQWAGSELGGSQWLINKLPAEMWDSAVVIQSERFLQRGREVQHAG